MFKNFFKILILLLPVVFFFSCKNNNASAGADKYTYQVPEQTSDGWLTASLSSVGIDESRLTELVNSIKNKVYREVHSVLIVKDDRLVFEEYFPGHLFSASGANYHGRLVNFSRETLHITHSATKSITSALVGIAVDRGFIGSVNEKIFTYFTGYLDLNDEGREKITIEHLLTMTSGLEWNEWDVNVTSPDSDLVRMNSAADPVRYVLSKPVVTEPGTSFYYTGGGVDVLGELVRISSGIPVDDFSGQYLFGPLGIILFEWQTLYPSGIIACHGDCYLRPRDMAKFGFLFLNNGVYQGKRIISQEFVKKSAEEYISLPQLTRADGYGYLWWLYTYKTNNRSFAAFRAAGWGGQQIIIFPGLEMVVVFTGANYVTNPPCEGILTSYILPAIL